MSKSKKTHSAEQTADYSKLYGISIIAAVALFALLKFALKRPTSFAITVAAFVIIMLNISTIKPALETVGSTIGTNTGSGTTTNSTIAYVNNPKATQVLNLRETPSQSARSIGQYRNGTMVKVVSRGSTWCEVYVGTKHGYMMTRYLSFNGHYLPPSYNYPTYVQPTPPPYWQPPNYGPPAYPMVTPTPTPLVQVVTPVPQQPSGPANPKAGDYVWLAISAGSGSGTINVYHDASMTSLKASYSPGKQVMMLQYGTNSSMIYVDGGVAYVSTWNINY